MNQEVYILSNESREKNEEQVNSQIRNADSTIKIEEFERFYSRFYQNLYWN